ncbi:hypothetical protein BKA62DRAFT_781388, partial [Auriculariales sp. MPI-PUGE-AT-0066]
MTSLPGAQDSELIFNPLTLPCGRTVENRLVKVAMTESLCRFMGGPPSDELLKMYQLWADGGWGMILTGNVHISLTHRGLLRDLLLNARAPSEEERVQYTALAQVIHKSTTGSRPSLAIVQLNHTGIESSDRQCTQFADIALGRPWQKPLAPSAIPLGSNLEGFTSRLVFGIMWQQPQAMSLDDIEAVKNDFVKAAVFCHECGFDGVEIHAAHGYLLAQFLSPLANKRTDKYADGALLVREICAAVRAAISPPFVVGVKMNAGDYISGGLTSDAALDQLEKLATCGVDFIEISGGSYEAFEFIRSASKREAFFAQFSRAALSRIAHIPEASRPKIVLTGGLNHKSVISDCLRAPHADFVGIGRQAVINPHLPHELLSQT